MNICSNFKILALATLVLSTSAFAEAVTKSKATELSVHRLERLVILKKIDESYQRNLSAISLREGVAADDGACFVATLRQHPGVDVGQNELKIFMDETGKTLKFEALPAVPSSNAPVWPDKDPATLVEAALHYVIENGPNSSDVAPFDRALVSISLRQERKDDGSLRAVFDVESSESVRILRIVIKTDGTFESANLF